MPPSPIVAQHLKACGFFEDTQVRCSTIPEMASGGPIISTDVRAVGLISSANYADHHVKTDGVSTGTGTHVRLGPQPEKVEEVTGLTLTLGTTPLAGN
jgi:hypothetical protein